jgi:hypothetical protein
LSDAETAGEEAFTGVGAGFGATFVPNLFFISVPQ